MNNSILIYSEKLRYSEIIRPFEIEELKSAFQINKQDAISLYMRIFDVSGRYAEFAIEQLIEKHMI